MYNNPFVLKPEEYQRDLNIYRAVCFDIALYLSKKTTKSYQECLVWVKNKFNIKESTFINDPRIMVIDRNSVGDRVQSETTLLEYLGSAQETGNTLSPSMVTYSNPDKKRSKVSLYVSNKVKERGKIKKEGQEAEMEGDKFLASIKQNLQTSIKILVNSVSGGHASESTALFLKSAHPSLTSTCRCATSYGNANTERFLSGNRHYWRYDIALNNIVSIVRKSDLKAIEEVIKRYNLHYPTVTEVMSIIQRSTDLYWHNEQLLSQIEKLVVNLEPVERAAYLYTQDFYSLDKFNPELTKSFINTLATKASEPHPDPEQVLADLDADILAFASFICAKELAGRTLKRVKVDDPHAYAVFANTVFGIRATLTEYKNLIRAFWVTNNPPPTVANFTNSVRRNVVVSDTDSTIFTVQNWVERFTGRMKMDDRTQAIAATMVFITSQTTIHLLATYSANMGVRPSQIHQLSMKNEYMFPIFMQTTKGKHYTAYMSAKEGNVFPQLKKEIKGVSLRNSKAPPQITAALHQFIFDAMDTLLKGDKLDLLKLLNRVADIEREVKKGLAEGKSEHLLTASIKPLTAYNNPNKNATPYFYHELWETVFADRYGNAPEPPYVAVKVSMDLKNKAMISEWLAEMPDEQMALKMEQFLKSKDRRYLKMLCIPCDVIRSDGLPVEIIGQANVREIIYSTMEGFYLVLESLGFYCINKRRTRLISDVY
ncbi:family B DNA polymerase [Endozoicomonas sp. ONNA1]|uniref:family B DNA polymerase n=1 Tax=Endozoicomonas sp. ONNA1 TaxID=2828740 RepID=UPI002147EC4E|nr:family B DNA polymerase [Endozoicomonas sp. ONNA1]